jgi:hypothetical protein
MHPVLRSFLAPTRAGKEENAMRKALALVLLLPCSTWAATEILKEEPPKNALPRGRIVYVDDGTCPLGEVKEVTGGNEAKGIPRKVRCVKRPS